VKELRLFALERVADELERPSHNEKHKSIPPQPVNQDAPDEQGERNENCRYPQGMAYPVYGVLMAAGILRDPLLIGAAAKHGAYDDTRLERSTGKSDAGLRGPVMAC